MPNPGWTTKNMPSLDGKIALVTGANRGLGYETALGLARAGATVIIAGRKETACQEAILKIRTIIPEAKLEFEKLDLSSLASVKEFSTSIPSKYGRLDILVNNAGILGPHERQTTVDGFELHFGTNHLAHFVLTALLLPLLKKTKGSRVVNVSSLGHRTGKINFDDLQFEKRQYSNEACYSQSKVANILFTLELQRRSDSHGWGILCTAAHPGFSRTDINTGPESNMEGLKGWITANVMAPLFSQDAAAGALPTLYAAAAPEAEKGGYYGPNGFYEMYGAVCTAYIAPHAKDEEACKKLWDVSVTLTGVTWE